MARVPEKRARVPSSARVPGVAHSCPRVSEQVGATVRLLHKISFTLVR